MCNVLRWIADPQVVVFVDTKQSCMAHGWGVITASIAVRGKLRYTTLGRSEGRRVQAGDYTSHAAPVLQAIINVENTDNILQFFDTLKRLLGTSGAAAPAAGPEHRTTPQRFGVSFTRACPHKSLSRESICVYVSLSLSLHVYV
jgi:hypothetical protein